MAEASRHLFHRPTKAPSVSWSGFDHQKNVAVVVRGTATADAGSIATPSGGGAIFPRPTISRLFAAARRAL